MRHATHRARTLSIAISCCSCWTGTGISRPRPTLQERACLGGSSPGAVTWRCRPQPRCRAVALGPDRPQCFQLPAHFKQSVSPSTAKPPHALHLPRAVGGSGVQWPALRSLSSSAMTSSTSPPRRSASRAVSRPRSDRSRSLDPQVMHLRRRFSVPTISETAASGARPILKASCASHSPAAARL